MDVFVVPVGHAQYELYCEHDVAPPVEPTHAPGPLGRLQARFSQMLYEAERRRQASAAGMSAPGTGGLWDRVMVWVAERIAEQRLLWNLRSETSVRLVHPSDMAGDRAVALVQEDLRRDRDRHWRWLAVDGVLLVVSGALAIVPGPNVLAYYFAFRVVGHWLSIRGARQGLGGIAWRPEASESLRELDAALTLEPAARAERVRELGERLQLPQLAAFLARVALRRP